MTRYISLLPKSMVFNRQMSKKKTGQKDKLVDQIVEVNSYFFLISMFSNVRSFLFLLNFYYHGCSITCDQSENKCPKFLWIISFLLVKTWKRHVIKKTSIALFMFRLIYRHMFHSKLEYIMCHLRLWTYNPSFSQISERTFYTEFWVIKDFSYY